MKTAHLILPAAVVLQIICCCLPLGGWGLAYEHDLVDNYSVWAADANEQACIVKKDQPNSNGASCVVPWMIFEYGWNDDFIIAKQHPAQLGEPINTTITNWYIIEVKSGKVNGPLSEEQFYSIRKTLNMPDDLNFTEVINP